MTAMNSSGIVLDDRPPLTNSFAQEALQFLEPVDDERNRDLGHAGIAGDRL
jgi:hypothetical protein